MSDELPPELPDEYPTDYLVVPAADAQRAREALGRLYAQCIAQPYPIPSTPPTPGAETLYYVDPRFGKSQESVEGSAEAALGPADAFIRGCVGQTTALGDGSSFTVPDSVQTLSGDWFE